MLTKCSHRFKILPSVLRDMLRNETAYIYDSIDLHEEKEKSIWHKVKRERKCLSNKPCFAIIEMKYWQ